MRSENQELEERLASLEARMRAIQEGIEAVKSRMGEMGK